MVKDVKAESMLESVLPVHFLLLLCARTGHMDPPPLVRESLSSHTDRSGVLGLRLTTDGSGG